MYRCICVKNNWSFLRTYTFFSDYKLILKLIYFTDPATNPSDPGLQPKSLLTTSSRDVLTPSREADDNATDPISRNRYIQLQKEVVALREAMDQLRSRHDRHVRELRGEIEEERAARSSLQKELEQIKEIVYGKFGLSSDLWTLTSIHRTLVLNFSYVNSLCFQSVLTARMLLFPGSPPWRTKLFLPSFYHRSIF